MQLFCSSAIKYTCSTEVVVAFIPQACTCKCLSDCCLIDQMLLAGHSGTEFCGPAWFADSEEQRDLLAVGGSHAQAMYNKAGMHAVNDEVVAAQQRVSSSHFLASSLGFVFSSRCSSLAFAFPPLFPCLSLFFPSLFPCLCLFFPSLFPCLCLFFPSLFPCLPLPFLVCFA